VKPELSIIIVLHNSADALEACLHSLRPAVESDQAELIAVDNASPDASLAMLSRQLPAARIVKLSENRGFAAGVNTALRSATGRYWLLLNPDVRVTPEGLKGLVAFMDRHPELAVASPELRGKHGERETPGRAVPSIARALLELTRLHRVLPAAARGRVLRGPYWTGGDQLATGWVPATALIVRPSAATEVGLMREDFFMYGEDLEWCLRMRRAGWKIGVCSRVEFRHDGSSSATRTFGEAEKERRIAAGLYAACRVAYGPFHARVLAAITALAHGLEAAAPRRDADDRLRARATARAWGRLATTRAPGELGYRSRSVGDLSPRRGSPS
jgi:N-acetylglucosaminyl-diphospho-decaprenol L-rhamnosyltransferase